MLNLNQQSCTLCAVRPTIYILPRRAAFAIHLRFIRFKWHSKLRCLCLCLCPLPAKATAL
jgi:hypothetical protein